MLIKNDYDVVYGKYLKYRNIVVGCNAGNGNGNVNGGKVNLEKIRDLSKEKANMERNR